MNDFRQIIESAPHDHACTWVHDRAIGRGNYPPRPCDCWKADALRELPEVDWRRVEQIRAMALQHPDGTFGADTLLELIGFLDHPAPSPMEQPRCEHGISLMEGCHDCQQSGPMTAA